MYRSLLNHETNGYYIEKTISDLASNNNNYPVVKDTLLADINNNDLQSFFKHRDILTYNSKLQSDNDLRKESENYINFIERNKKQILNSSHQNIISKSANLETLCKDLKYLDNPDHLKNFSSRYNSENKI